MVDTSKVILRKKETTYNTDAAPTAAANAALTRRWRGTPLAADTLDRGLDRPSLGRTRSANTNRRSTFGYELEIAGSGAPGTAPAWMVDLEACGMVPPILTATTKAEQKFIAAGATRSALTYHWWLGNQKHIATGARGTFGMDFTVGAYPFITLDMMGLVGAAPVSQATPDVPVLTNWIEPVEVHTDNTDFLLDGYAAILQSFVLTANAQVAVKNYVGENYIRRGNHAMTGRIRIKAPDVTAKNYYTSLKTGAEIATELIHGITAGNIVELKADHVQILGIEHVEEDDELIHDISVGLNINTGQDDLLITAK